MNECTIDISNLFNHKIFYDYYEDHDEERFGIIGMGIHDDRYLFKSEIKVFNGINFIIKGELSKYDNLICDGQEIAINNNYSKMFILGFNEFGNYADTFEFIDVDNNITKRNVFFNGFNQVIEGLYENETNQYCKIADSFKANGYIATNIYMSKIDISLSDRSVIVPVNPELHIMAITLI